jgi:hypothetical protein
LRRIKTLSTAGMRNVDKAAAKPFEMTRHKKVKARAMAGSKFLSRAVTKKQQRGHFHKLKKKKKLSKGG